MINFLHNYSMYSMTIVAVLLLPQAVHLIVCFRVCISIYKPFLEGFTLQQKFRCLRYF